MIDFLKQLPHLEPYGNPQYFVYIILAVLPVYIGLFFKKRFAFYEILVSLAFIIFMLTGPELTQVYALLAYVVWQSLLIFSYKYYRQKWDNKWVFYLYVFLAVLPLIIVKLTPALQTHRQSPLGFLGIS